MQPSLVFTRTTVHRSLLALCLAVAFATIPTLGQGPTTPKPNYDLASQWTSEKVGKIVFDTSVTSRWLEAGDRFWYTYQTRDGRRFHLVDPAKKTKAPLFDHAKMAATLTAMIGQPYDTQHLPFSTVRFVKKDAAFQFDVQVPRDLQINAKPIATKPKITTDPDGQAADDGDPETQAAADQQQQQQTQQQQQQTQQQQQQKQQTQQTQQGQRGQQTGRGAAAQPPRNRTLRFEYDMATGKVDLLDDNYQAPRRPRWASFSPDKKTILFARNDRELVCASLAAE